MKTRISFLNIILTIVSIVIANGFIQAQSIKGIVTDNNNTPIEYANIILSDLVEKTPINYAISDSTGFYSFTNLKSNKYLIEFSMIGFTNFTSDTIVISEKSKDNILNCNLQGGISLSEVSIVAKRPKIIERADKTIINLENTTNVGSNVLSVLKKVPGVIVSRNVISAKGQEISTILINGKNTNHLNMESVLNNINGDNIAKIEIIYQADATYEASGSGVILNVILKKNRLEGKNGYLGAMLGKTKPLDYSESFGFSYLKNRFNFLLSQYYSSKTWQETNTTNRIVGNEKYFQQSINDYKPQYSSISLDLDYFSNPKNTIGVYVGYNKFSNNWEGKSTVEVEEAINSITAISKSKQTTSKTQNYWSINPYYEFRWNKKKGDLLRADFRYIQHQSKEITQFSLIEQKQIEIIQPNNARTGSSDSYSFQFDFTKEINNSFSVASGLQHDKINLSSLFENFAQTSEQDFKIIEEITGVYTQLKYKSDKLNAKLGLRWEYSFTEGFNVGSSDKNTRKISQLFPSFSLSYPLSNKIRSSFSYSYRINRPDYSSLNPFQHFYDPLLSDSGNPKLKPEFTHSGRLNFSTNRNISLSASFKRTKGDIFELVEQDEQNKAIRRRLINIDRFDYLGLNLTLPYNISSNIEASTSLSARFQNYQSSLELFTNENSKWTYVFKQNFLIALPLELELEGAYWIASGRLNGLMETDWYSGAYFSISRTFMNDKIQFNLEFEDLIARGIRHKIEYEGINSNIVNQWNNYNLFLRLKYNFGSKFVKNAKRKRGSSGTERLN